MGIGTTKVEEIDVAVERLAIADQREAYAEVVNEANKRLYAIDSGLVSAKEVFAATKPSEFEAVAAAEIAKKRQEQAAVSATVDVLDVVANAKSD